nr:MAG TPA: hypothetical protein [Caudoviricetes sp.]
MTGRRIKRVLNRVSPCLQDFSLPQRQKNGISEFPAR